MVLTHGGTKLIESWKENKRWSDRFIDEIKSILGLYLIKEPPIEEDQERNTDLISLKFDSVRIACRVRRFQYYIKYPHDITIRAGKPSGLKTELHKIIEGWGDYLFYGFSDPDEKIIIAWYLCDLNRFRTYLTNYLLKNKGEMPGVKKHNSDNSSFYAFNAYRINDFIVFKKGV